MRQTESQCTRTLTRALTAIVAFGLLAGATACDEGDGGLDDSVLLTPGVIDVTPPSLLAGDDTAGDPPQDPAVAALLTDLESGARATYRAVYRTTAAEGGGEDTYTVVSAPPLTRIDLEPPADTGESRTATLARAGTTTVTCVDEGGWTCTESPALDASLLAAAGPVIYPAGNDLQQARLEELGEREIAGQATRCVRLSTGDGESARTADYCLNPEGVALFATSDAGTAEATEFATDVSDEDFKLPG